MFPIFLSVFSFFLQPQTDPVITRIYPIQDLLITVPDFTNTPQFDINQALSNSGSGPFQSTNNQIQSFPKTSPQEIILLIEENIDPDLWIDNPEKCFIRSYKGNLIIKAPLSTHQKLK